MFKSNMDAFWGTTKNILMIGEGNPWLALTTIPMTIIFFWLPLIALGSGLFMKNAVLSVSGAVLYLVQYLSFLPLRKVARFDVMKMLSKNIRTTG